MYMGGFNIFNSYSFELKCLLHIFKNYFHIVDFTRNVV